MATKTRTNLALLVLWTLIAAVEAGVVGSNEGTLKFLAAVTRIPYSAADAPIAIYVLTFFVWLVGFWTILVAGTTREKDWIFR